jgi:mannose-6-phosphate isomerase-like protein (cupin superfamily)
MQAVSKYNSLKHYRWGADCDGWNLVDTPTLSVKQEYMPAGTFEQLHYHNGVQQFFFILRGTASFEVGDEIIEVTEGNGLHIPSGKRHCIRNNTQGGLEFILCSEPTTVNDRINCHE